MHELSVALALVESATERLHDLGPSVRITAVHVRVGRWSGVVADALRFSFSLAAEGSAIDGARLVIDERPVEVTCAICGSVAAVEVELPAICSRCGAPDPAMTGGRELQLAALEVVDAAEDCRSPSEYPEEERSPRGGPADAL